MYETEFNLSTITPLYMHGTDKKNLELRPSEFKGMIRFWWRALKAYDNIQKLKEEEEKIFGGTSENSGRSNVLLKIIEHNSNNSGIHPPLSLDSHYNKKEHRLEGKDVPISYLLYTVRELSYLSSSFSLSICSKDEKAFKNALAGLWCAINLGGFGSRSRRGTGALKVEQVNGETYGLAFKPEGENSKEMSQWIIENTKKARILVEKTGAQCSSYSNLNKAEFIISQNSFETWEEALRDVGKTYMDFRTPRKKEIQLGNFGLPIVHRSDGSVIKAEYTGNHINRKKEKHINRRASPISFKILQSQIKFNWMALKFAGDIFPKGTKLIWSEKEEVPQQKILDDFWNSLKAKNPSYKFF
jgi:CRISPR-associated protein Cmr1